MYVCLFPNLLLYPHCAILREDEDVIITDVLQVSSCTVLYINYISRYMYIVVIRDYESAFDALRKYMCINLK